MARWRLKDKHYLAVPGTEWEYKESDRETGRSARKVYEVPLYLDPNMAADWNYRDQEAIIVTNKPDKAFPRDIVFVGDPTPDMEPLDEEAEAITQSFVDAGKWKHPIEALNMTYSQSMLSEFEQQLARLLAGQAPKVEPKNVSAGGVDPRDFEKLQQQVAMLMDRNAQLEEQLATKPKVARRI